MVEPVIPFRDALRSRYLARLDRRSCGRPTTRAGLSGPARRLQPSASSGRRQRDRRVEAWSAADRLVLGTKLVIASRRPPLRSSTSTPAATVEQVGLAASLADLPAKPVMLDPRRSGRLAKVLSCRMANDRDQALDPWSIPGSGAIPITPLAPGALLRPAPSRTLP